MYQVFGKIGWQNDKTDIDLSYSYADTSLFGANGAVPESMLDFRRAASYTPDFTQNLLNFANLTGTQFLTDHWLLSANVYYRHLTTDSANGNVNDNYLSGDYSGPSIDCTAPPLARADLAYCSAAQNATSHLVQRTAGRRPTVDGFARCLRLEEPSHLRCRLQRRSRHIHAVVPVR